MECKLKLRETYRDPLSTFVVFLWSWQMGQCVLISRANKVLWSALLIGYWFWTLFPSKLLLWLAVELTSFNVHIIEQMVATAHRDNQFLPFLYETIHWLLEALSLFFRCKSSWFYKIISVPRKFFSFNFVFPKTLSNVSLLGCYCIIRS